MNFSNINSKSFEEIEEIFSYLPDLILLVNNDGDIVIINKQALKIFGY